MVGTPKQQRQRRLAWLLRILTGFQGSFGNTYFECQMKKDFPSRTTRQCQALKDVIGVLIEMIQDELKRKDEPTTSN